MEPAATVRSLGSKRRLGIWTVCAATPRLVPATPTGLGDGLGVALAVGADVEVVEPQALSNNTLAPDATTNSGRRIRVKPLIEQPSSAFSLGSEGGLSMCPGSGEV